MASWGNRSQQSHVTGLCIAVASPAGCSGDEAVAVGTDVDDWATGGRG